MKRIAIVSAINFNENSAGAQRVNSYCKALKPKIDELYLISLFSMIKENKFEFENIEDNIFSCLKPNIHLSRIKSLYVFIGSFHIFFKQYPDSKIIIYPSSYFVFDFAFILYLFYQGIPFYVELNEVRKYNQSFIKNDFFSGAIISNNLKKVFSYPFYLLMDVFFKQAKGHIYISTKIADYYKKKNSIIIPILCNSKNTTLRDFKNHNNSDVFSIGFAGAIDLYKEKMSTFFESIMNILKIYPNIRINLYGIFFGENEFYTLLDKYDIKDLFYYKGNISSKELVEKLKKDNHLLILPRGFTKQNYYGFSTKLSVYLEAQRPILTTNVGDIGKYFIDMENSFTYEADNVSSLTEKLSFIIQNYNLVSPDIIKGGDRLVNEVFHYSNYSDDLHSLLFK